MSKRSEEQEEQGPVGCPEWMLTYSDSVTLLCTFFIMLLTFSSFDKETFQRLATSMVGSARPGLSQSPSRGGRESLTWRERLRSGRAQTQGSEMPAMLQESDTEDVPAVDLAALVRVERVEDARVIIVPSRAIFLGSTAQLSHTGKAFLQVMVELVQSPTAQITVAEIGPEDIFQSNTRSLGAPRAWQVIQYLTGEQSAAGIENFGLSTASILPEAREVQKRRLEIWISRM